MLDAVTKFNAHVARLLDVSEEQVFFTSVQTRIETRFSYLNVSKEAFTLSVLFSIHMYLCYCVLTHEN